MIYLRGSNVVADLNRSIDNGRWLITTEQCYRNYDGLTINITSPQIDHVILSGAGNIVAIDTFSTDRTDILLPGSGNIIWRTHTNKLTTIISGSGTVNVQGVANEMDLIISGSGDVQARDIPTEVAEVLISGSGSADVTVTDVLDAVISGSGSITYGGNPSTVDQRVTGSGSIRPRE